MNGKFTVLGVAVVAAALLVFGSAWTVSRTWERVRTKPSAGKVTVTGSAVKRIVSDLAEWNATVEAKEPDRVSAYRSLKEQTKAAVQFVEGYKIPANKIRVSAATMHQEFRTEYEKTQNGNIRHRVPSGWSARQEISLQSTDIHKVEQISREITKLLEDGVTIHSESPLYHYTKLSEVKIDMLAKASEDARNRATRIIEAAGGGSDTGTLRTARMGVININPANSTASSWDGNNDKTSLEKDIITIVHLTYSL